MKHLAINLNKLEGEFMDSIREYYKSFKLVARIVDGEWRSAAWFPYYKKVAVTGLSADEVLSKIRLKVDEVVSANYAEFQKAIKDKHAEYLVSCGQDNKGVGIIQNKHRYNNCHVFRCGRTVDNTYDIECRSCGWIVCAKCGSCGCGYGQGYAGKAG